MRYVLQGHASRGNVRGATAGDQVVPWLRTRGWAAKILAVSLALLLGGCSAGGASVAPTPPPVVSTPAATLAAATPLESPSPAPSVAAAPAQPSGWDQVVAAARREGMVSVIGPPGDASSTYLAAAFTQDYPDVQVDFLGTPPGDATERMENEAAAGRNQTDVYVGGSGLGADFIDSAFDPIQNDLVGPDADPANWLGGQFAFADSGGQYYMILLSGVSTAAVFNTDVVDPSQIRSYKDFLNPEWKGKIVLQDPTIPAAGQTFMSFLWVTPSLGKDYIQQLFAQNPTISRDERQPIDWIARNEYPVGLGVSSREATVAKGQGLPVGLLSANRLQDGGYLSSSLGGVGVVRQPPHPNAAKLYVNWLLSRDGELAVSKLAGLASRRTDVSVADQGVDPDFVPQPGWTYVASWDQDLQSTVPAMLDFVKPLMGS